MSDRDSLRADGLFRANNVYGDYIGVMLGPANVERGLPATWRRLDFRNRHVLDVWFRDSTLSPDRFVYVAAFDKTSPEWLAGTPISEMYGAGLIGDQPSIGR